MLRITMNINAREAVEYFTQALQKEDYFYSDNSAKTRVQGEPAYSGNIRDIVTKEAFSKLINETEIITSPKGEANKKVR